MAIRIARDQLGRIFSQRCFYLFLLLLVLIGAVPFVEPTPAGRMLVNAINIMIMIATVAAVGRSTLSFVIIVLLALGVIATQYFGISWDDARHLAHSWAFGAALYAFTIAYMLRYVFQPDVMTADKLFGAAAAYLMLGIFWMLLYALVGYYYPGSFSVAGAAATPEPMDLLYFSFTVLTSTGFGDIVAVTRQARAICVLEQLTGTLFLAILIARLAGVYPASPRRERT
ncbi:MAG: ion channel [Casimicrobiaceae bacterium]